MKLIFTFFLSCLSLACFAQLPSTPAIWLRADSGVVLTYNAVSTWTDVSGNGNHVTQGNLNNRPFLQRNIFNDKPAINFIASTFLNNTSSNAVTSGNGRTVFVVSKAVCNSLQQFPITFRRSAPLSSYQATSANLFYADASVTANNATATAVNFTVLKSKPTLTTYHHSAGGKLNLRVNQVAQAITQTGNTIVESGTTGFSVGRREDNASNTSAGSLIAEIIVYDTQLSTADIAIVENYLTAKYATNAPAITSAYAASSGKVYTASATYTGYTPISLGDSNACTGWGGPNWGPQSATVDLLTPITVKRLLVCLRMTPNGVWNGDVQLSSNGTTWVTVANLNSASHYNGEVIPIELSTPMPNIRYAKLTGVSSVSWIAANEFCVNPDLVNRSIPGLNPVIMNGADSSFLGSGQVLIGQTLIASKAETYQWTRNGVAIPGEISQRLVVTQSGAYNVIVTYPCATCNQAPIAIAANNSSVPNISPNLFPNCGLNTGVASSPTNTAGASIIDSTHIANNNFTFELWFKSLNSASNATNDRILLSKGNTIRIKLTPAGTINVTSTIGGVVKFISSSVSFGDGGWHHLATTYDGTTLKLFVDGDSVHAAAAIGSVAVNAVPLTLGTTNQGTIDEVKIWDTALSKSQIIDNLDSNFTGAETHLKAYYTFNDNMYNGANRVITNFCTNTGSVLNGITFNYVGYTGPTFDCAAPINTTPSCNIQFSNATDKIIIPSNTSLQSNSFSVSAYFKTTQSAPLARLVSLHDGAGNTKFSICLNNGKAHVRIANAAANVAFAEYSPALNNNSYSKITLTYNDTIGQLKLYVGKLLVATTTTTIVPVSNPAQYLELGSINGTNNYIGKLDEVAIYNKALTQTDIDNNNFYLLSGNESGIVAFYNFDDNDSNGANRIILNKCSATGVALNGSTIGSATSPSFTCSEVTLNRPNCSIMLNGTSEGMGTSVLSNWTASGSFTMEFICKPTTNQHNGPYYTTNSGYLIGQHYLMQASANVWPYNTNGLNVGVATNGIHVFQQSGAYNHNGILGYNKPITDWVHIAITKGLTGLVLYVNGKPVSSCGNLTIFTNYALFGQYFAGNIAEIRLWDQPLPADSIHNNINKTYLGTEPNLVALYRFNNNTSNGTGKSIAGLGSYGTTNPLITSGNAQTPVFTCANYNANTTTERVKLAGSGHCYHNSAGRANLNSWGTMNNTGTINLWIKPATLSGRNIQNIFSTAPLLGDKGGNTGVRLELDSMGNLYAIFGDSLSTDNTTTNRFLVNSGMPLGINKQYHIALTWNKIANTFSFYLNGINTILNASNTKWPNQFNEVNLGMGYKYPEGVFFNAEMDELCHWNIELSETQIRERMTKKIIAADPLYASLVNYYQFEQVPNLYNTTTQAVYDYKGTKHGIKYNSYAYNYSSSPIGDVSGYNYSGNSSTAKVGFGLVAGADSVSANLTTGTADGLHVYGVNEAPNTTVGINNPIVNNNRYAGVFVVNPSDAKYTLRYNYGNNANAYTSNEQNLKLFKRVNNSDQIWYQSNNLSLDTANNFLQCTGQNTEYILAKNTDVLIPLSLNLLSFKANKTSPEEVTLNWKTSNEVEVNKYIIERSTDGQSFQAIGEQAARNTNGENIYSVIDNKLPQNMNVIYYRLVLLNENGQVDYSQIEKIYITKNYTMSVFPNPVKNYFSIGTTEKIKAVKVFNCSGQCVASFDENTSNKYDLTALPIGLYTVKVFTKNAVSVIKINKE
jgi:hypothetical protein